MWHVDVVDDWDLLQFDRQIRSSAVGASAVTNARPESAEPGLQPECGSSWNCLVVIRRTTGTEG
jgi:hypothetical protein